MVSSAEIESRWVVQSPHGTSRPYSLVELRQKAQRRQLTRSSLICRVGSNTWIIASQVPAIFADESGHPALSVGVNRPAAASPPPIPLSLPKSARYTSPLLNPIVASTMAGMAFAIIVLLVAIIAKQSSSPTDVTSYGGSDQSIASLTAEKTDSRPTENKSTDANLSQGELPRITPTAVAGPHAPNFSTEELVSRTVASVAVVFTPEGSGSGFMVADQVIATNYHVIADADSNSIEAFFPDGPENGQGPYRATLIDERPNLDLALLRVDASAPVLEVDVTHTFRRGQDVVIIGSPSLFKGQDLLPNAVTRGVLSSHATLGGLSHYQLSAAVNPGNSGGPVFGLDGRVIGVVVSKSNSEEAIGFCVPAVELGGLLSQNSVGGFVALPEAESQHNARRTARGVILQLIARTVMIKQISDDYEASGRRRESVSLTGVASSFGSIFARSGTALARDFNHDLSSLASDRQLTIQQRSAIEDVRQCYQTLNRLISSPPTNLAQFMAQFGRLSDECLDQCRSLNRSLELGMPDLLN